MLMHFDITVSVDSTAFLCNEARIAVEAGVDSTHVIRTSLPTNSVGPASAAEAYKALSGVERACRCAKSDLSVRQRSWC